ncbi:MAG: response regulator transcription factor [Planctomycetaceae bacterium]|nr:response regulator transcription factor [Planctomycetales bacterium]MCB9923824.1 response regulator transcription factor [Planctomycetaceae bacterium]
MRIIVADDRDLIRAGLREYTRSTDLELVGEGTISETSQLLDESGPIDLLILGIEPPGTTGLGVIERLKASGQRPVILIYAARTSSELIAKAIADGVGGLLTHDATHETFLQSCRSVASGETLWSREDLRRAGSVGRLTDSGTDVQLTRRESEVIVKMVEGLTNKQIAQSLEISYETVKEHVQHILRKLGVTDRTQAAVWAVRHGLA